MEYNNVKKSWLKIINKETKKEYYQDIKNILDNEKYYPPRENIFEAFKYFELKETKLVIVGQDPYINENQAMGLSFSVPKNEKIPPSLKNIYKELNESCDFIIPNHGDLTNWCNQKILLLNGALTVQPNKSNSHAKYWIKFTDKIIKKISKKNKGCVFLLLGKYAQSKESLIDSNKHIIIKGVHPSPLSANYQSKGNINSFFGNQLFNQVNQSLIKLNHSIINWQI